jgi:uncharacterized lipoprotein YajG
MVTSRKLVLTLLIVILAFLFSACSHVMMPRGPIPVKMDVVGAMNANKTISLQNDVPESKLTMIASQGYHKYYADYRVWTGLIVNQLETELRSRGVQVGPDSQDVFKVRVEQAGIFWGSFSTRCVVNVRVERKDGTWSRSFEGNTTSPMSLYRAIDYAVYKAVVAILQDREFMNAMSR